MDFFIFFSFPTFSGCKTQYLKNPDQYMLIFIGIPVCTQLSQKQWKTCQGDACNETLRLHHFCPCILLIFIFLFCNSDRKLLCSYLFTFLFSMVFFRWLQRGKCLMEPRVCSCKIVIMEMHTNKWLL